MKKILSSILIFVMVVSYSISPSTVFSASSGYAISINEPISISGTTVNLSGIASANNYVGQKSQQHVSIWWSAGSLSGPAEDDMIVPAGAFSGNGFSFNFTKSHIYTPGTYTITVKVCHQNCTGAEGSGDSVDTAIVVIPPITTGGLVVKKVLINDNGGTTATTTFSFQINGGSPIAFEADGQNDFVKTAGAYTVTEVSNSGYVTTYSAGCSAGVSVSATTTCIITNNDLQGTLIVKKVLPNDNGGDAIANNFSFKVNGESAIVFEADGQNDLTVNAGIYNVVENGTPILGYLTTYNSCNSINLLSGETKTCTITNDDIAPKLTVLKTIINNNGGTKINTTDFTLLVGIQEVLSGVLNSFNPNTYQISEQNNTGYTPTFGGDCVSGLVSLSLGDNKTCTITNDDNEPSLTLNKIVIDDNDNNGTTLPSAWILKAVGSTGFLGAGPSVSNGSPFSAGNYDLSETGPAGYSQSDWVCSGGSQTDGDTVVIGLGQNVTCTITNNDLPLPLCSNGSDDDGDGLTDISDPGCHFDLDAENPDSYQPEGVSEGNETTLALCSDEIDNDNDQSVDLDDIDCKNFIPKLIVNKIVINDNFGDLNTEDFSFTINDGSSVSFEADGSNNISVDPGSYTVEEVFTLGYDSFLSDTCSGTISIGETKTCTITNDDQVTKLIVKKVLINDSGKSLATSTFSFYLNDDSEDGIIFETDGENDLVLQPGNYSVTENLVAGYNTIYDSCDEISLSLGETKMCIITNDDIPACSDRLDNDNDELTDANDPACHSDENPNNPQSYNPEGISESGDLDFTPPNSLFDNAYNHTIISTELLALSLTGTSTDNFPGVKSGVDSALLKVFKIADNTTIDSANFNEQFEEMSCASSEDQVPVEIVSLSLTNLDLLPLYTRWSHNWTPSRGVYCFEVHGKDKAGNDEHTAIAGPIAYTFTAPVIPPVTTPTPTPPTPPSGGGGGSNGPITGSFGGGGGLVLGVSVTTNPVGQVLGESCGLYMNKHIRLGSKKNNGEQVKKLQTFLNKNMSSALPITGFYGNMTYGVIKNFQNKYREEILTPWNLKDATGLVYLSTLTQINNLECPDIMDLPALVPWSENPTAQ